MHNHAPKDYKCSICLGINGIENDDTLIKSLDIIYKDSEIFAFISSFFIGSNPGHIIISPIKHLENLYDIDEKTLSAISNLSKKVALKLKESYKCSGITILQNNEPDGGQHAFHYHMHVFPRYKNDDLHKHMLDKRVATIEEKKEYARMFDKF